MAIEADRGAEFVQTEDGVVESVEGVSATTFVGVGDTWTCVMGAADVDDVATVLCEEVLLDSYSPHAIQSQMRWE